MNNSKLPTLHLLSSSPQETSKVKQKFNSTDGLDLLLRVLKESNDFEHCKMMESKVLQDSPLPRHLHEQVILTFHVFYYRRAPVLSCEYSQYTLPFS